MNRIPDHRRSDAVFVRGKAVCESTLDATVTAVGFTALVGAHAHDLIPTITLSDLGLKGATHTAVRTGGHHALCWRTLRQHAVFDQRRGRARTDAGTTGHTVGIHKPIVLSGNNARLETTPLDRQREGSLHLVTGTHTAAAENALAGIKAEVGIGYIFFRAEVVHTTAAVTRALYVQSIGNKLKLVVAGVTVRTIFFGLIGEIEFDHIAAQFPQPVAFG